MIVLRTQILRVALLLCLAAACPSAWAQTEGSELNPFHPGRSGLGVYDITLFSQYYSSARPTFSLPSIQTQNLGFDVSSGVSGTVGWNHPGLRTSAGATYNGSYGRRARYPDWNTNDHALNLWLNRTLARSWNLRVSADGGVRTLDHFLFQNATVLSYASLPGTLDDMATSMLRGDYSNEQLASMLTGLPVVATPAETLIYGNRFLSSGASVTLSYAATQRLQVNWGVGGGRIQALPDGSGTSRALLNQSTRANVHMGVSYALTPRTELSFLASAGRQFSILSNRDTVRGTLTLSRALTRQWFASVDAGAGTYLSAANTAVTSPVQSIGGLSLGHRGYAQTWMFSAHRTLADSFGVGSRSTVVVDLGWTLNRPGSNWFLTASASQQYMDRSVLNTMTAWRLMAGAGRRIGRELAVKTEYAYTNYSLTGASVSGLLPHASLNAVRMELVWNPLRIN